MHPKALEKRVLLSLGVALAILAMIGIMIQHRQTKFIDVSKENIQKYMLLNSLENLLSTLQEADNGRRGYVLTGNKEYLEPYFRAKEVYPAEWAQVVELKAKNPDAPIDLASLKPVIDDAFADMEETIKEREAQGLPKALETINTNRGERDMEKIRSKLQLQEAKVNAITQRRAMIAKARARQMAITFWLGTAVSMGLVLIAFWRLRREIAARLRAAEELHKLNEELDLRVQKRTEELNRTNEALRMEIAERKQAQMELAWANIKKYLILKSAGEGIYGLDTQGKTTFINPAAIRMLGWEAGELIGQSMHEKLHHTKPDGSPYPSEECPIYATIRDGVERHLDGEVFWRKDGTSFPVDYLTTPMRSEEGELVGAVVTFRDISRRKEAEQKLRTATERIQKLNESLEARVRERTAQLEAVNKGLEAFSYSISHDLRSPIRTIVGFSSLLAEEEAARLSSDGLDLLDHIKVAAINMDRMVSGLLDLARLGQQPMPKSTLDMNRLAQEVIDDVMTPEDKGKTTVKINPLPLAQGNAIALRQVLANLLTNALKYSHNRSNPTIEVGARQEDGEQVYFVKDNGVGFDMGMADRLFLPFQRLHGGEFEGTGVGLATASRIIRSHGGRIWAEGKIDEGSTFFFTLPRQPLS